MTPGSRSVVEPRARATAPERGLVGAGRRPSPLAGMPATPTADNAGHALGSHAAWAAATAAAAASVAAMGLVRPAGPGNSGLADLFIAGAVLAILLWAASARVPLSVPYAVPATLLVLGGAIGAIVGDDPVIGLLTLAQDIVLVVWCIALANIARTPTGLSLLMRTWTWAAIGYASLILAAWRTGTTTFAGVAVFQDGGRATLTFSDPNMAGSYLVVSALIVVAIGYPRRRLWRWAVLLLLLAAIFLTGSNGGFIALVVGLGIYGVDATVRRYGAIMTIGLAAALFVVMAVSLDAAMSQRLPSGQVSNALQLSIGRSGESLLWRQRAKQYAVELFYDGNPLGAGPASSVERLRDRPDAQAIELHDDYLAALVERGVIGFTGIVLLVLTLLRNAWATSTRPLRPDYAAVVRRPIALLGAVLGALILGFVYEILHFRHMWALFAIVAALWLWGRE
jgi:O-antigen ligase